MREIQIEIDHIREATSRGAVCIKGKVEGRAAYPDQLVMKKNKAFYWVEFKTETGSLQPDQVEMHKTLKKKGHKIYLCRSIKRSDAIIAKEFD